MKADIRWTSPENDAVKVQWSTGSDIFKIYEHGRLAYRGSNQAVPDDFDAAEKVATRFLDDFLAGKLPRNERTHG